LLIVAFLCSLRGLDSEDDSELVTEAIKDFQHFAGIELTGKLDKLTLELMQLPRCGVRDIIDAPSGSERRRRRRRYALEGSRWKKREVTI
jgi:matrix metalloproteinase-14 (membrane-inserted)